MDPPFKGTTRVHRGYGRINTDATVFADQDQRRKRIPDMNRSTTMKGDEIDRHSWLYSRLMAVLVQDVCTLSMKLKGFDCLDIYKADKVEGF